MNRFMAVVWGGAALCIGYMALSIALGPKGDSSGWVLSAIFALVAAFFARNAWKDWRKPDVTIPKPLKAPQPAPRAVASPGLLGVKRVPLEDQIRALADAGLTLAPGRTVDELLHSWPREDYEGDPYNLLLFMYGSEVEDEPWGRFFTTRGWDFDMECLTQAGDYAVAFTQIARITSRPDLVNDLSDDFDIDADTATIRYTLAGRPRVLKARVDNDWADPEAAGAFVRDLEGAVGDGRRFWASDNGQSSVLFFLTDAEAAAINALRPEILMRYVRD